jgi:hypothetical protein
MLAKGRNAATHERSRGDIPDETNNITGTRIEQAKREGLVLTICLIGVKANGLN